MGIEVELLEQLKAATEAIKTVAEALTINANGSINVNELTPLQHIMIKDGEGNTYKAKVNSEGRILVDTNLVISPNAIITDPNDPNKQANVNLLGRLLVETERQGDKSAIIVDSIDSNKKASVDNQGRLLVNAISGTPGLIGSVKIEDSIDSNKKATVDDSGRLLVSTPPPQAPPNTTPVILTGFGPVSGDVDQEYLITNTKTLIIGRLLAGAAGMNKAGRITLYDNPDGNKVTLNIIATLYVNGDSDIADLSEKFVGNGIRKIILRRSNLGGGSAEMFARFEGYEE